LVHLRKCAVNKERWVAARCQDKKGREDVVYRYGDKKRKKKIDAM